MYVSVQILSDEEKYSCLEWMCLEEQSWVACWHVYWLDRVAVEERVIIIGYLQLT